LYSEPALDQYLDGVMSRVAGPGFEEKYGVDLKVYVIKDPYFNAFAFPNGSIYVHTGLLASMENEAQLAHVLGHEATHFMNRHVLRQWRSTVNKTAFMKSFEILTSGVAAYGGIAVVGLVGDLTGLGIIGTMAGYSRELEEEADGQGFTMIREAGYDAAQAVRTFEILEDALKDEKNKVPFFYSSHPQAKARVARMKKFVEKVTVSEGEQALAGEVAAERYAENIMPLILDNVALDIKRNNLRLARRQVERYVALRDADPRAYFLMGEETFLGTGEKYYRYQDYLPVPLIQKELAQGDGLDDTCEIA
jgi:predicted Zn-dependent protease